MTMRKRWKVAHVLGCLTLGACCGMPVGEVNDSPGVAAALAGSWQALHEGEEVLRVYFDGTGDPASVTLSAALLEDELASGLPTRLFLNGQAYEVAVPDVPFTLTYVGTGQASKTDPSGPIAEGQTLSITLTLTVYANSPLPLQSLVQVGTIRVTFNGTFQALNEAVGTVTSRVTLTSNAQQLLSLVDFDIPLNDLNKTLTNVRLLR